MKPHCKGLVIIRQYSDYPLPLVAEWYKRNVGDIEIVDVSSQEEVRFLNKKQLLVQWSKAFLAWLPRMSVFKNKRIYCTSAHIPFLLLTRIFNRYLGNYHIYLYNFYLHGLGKNRWVQKTLGVLLDNGNVTMIAQSEGEVEYYKRLSSKCDVRFVPFCSDFKPDCEGSSLMTESDGPYIFTGGYTNRDYEIVLALAQRFPDLKFVIVTSSLNDLKIDKNANNVEVYKDLSSEDFERLLTCSWIVIVPLKDDVGASGQMLSISAIRNNKPTVYADLSVVNYYFKDRPYSYPYSLGDLDSAAEALRSCVDETSDRETVKSVFESAGKDDFTNLRQLEEIRKIMGL